jgi:hypothetical protein
MTTTTATALSLRPAKNVYDRRPGFLVSIVNGPQDLLWRGTEEAALRDGAAYAAKNWALTPDGWKAI